MRKGIYGENFAFLGENPRIGGHLGFMQIKIPKAYETLCKQKHSWK